MTDRRSLLAHLTRRRMLIGSAGFAAAASTGFLPQRLFA